MSDNIDLLFLGRMFPKNKGEEIRKKARVDMQDAANVLQWNLVKGFMDNGIDTVRIVSLLPIDSWPSNYKDAFVKYDNENYSESFSFETVGFCNVTYAKQILSSHACDKAVSFWAKNKNGSKKILICYSENNVLMRAVKAAKKVNRDILAIQIIADITEFAANADLNCIQRAYVNSQIKTNRKLREFFDGFVLLTEHMRQKLKINKPYVVVEGIASNFDELDYTTNYCDKKTILYTGSMNKKYGILELMAAFSKIESTEYELILCGLGNAESIINDYCKNDKRIRFLGKVDHKDVMKLQRRVTVLVNPRQNNEEFTKYSFPSKNLEYLSSGVPLVAYKLDGIPDEYDQYINYVKDNSVEALRDVLIEACEDKNGEAAERAKRAAEFVKNEKNAKKQAQKIIELLELI